MSKQRAKRIGKGVRFIVYSLCSVFIVMLAWSGLAYAKSGDLKENIPDLCYRCHVKLQQGLSFSYVHFPFQDGKCISCHNAHASSSEGLMREDVNSLCLSCHSQIDSLLKEKFVHPAIKKGSCTDCHYSHSGENSGLLVKAQKDLCWTCHETLKDQLEKSFVHSPFSEGECSSCHNPHASSQEDQILDAPKVVCKKCHPPQCKAGDVSITFATEKMDCTSCHGGHASDTSGLLGPYGHKAFLSKTCGQCHNPILPDIEITTKMSGSNLCFSCHKKDRRFKENDVHGSDAKGGCAMCHSYHASKRKNLTVKESVLCFTCHATTERSTALMEKALKGVRCVPVKDRQCFECHIPPHSQNPLYLRAGDIDTCTRCHVEQHKVAHPLGEDVKDPRNGEPITCITCHSMHSSKAEFMLIYDRKRQLCIQCHKK